MPSDKGGEFCIIERTRYIELGKEHLSNDSLYQEVPNMSARTVETKINNIWKSVAKRNNLSFAITKGNTSTNTDLPRFYFLIKTHKTGNVPKIRPIISNVNGPSTKISWLLDKALKPLIEHIPAHLENTAHLIDRLKSLPKEIVQSHNYPCSLDVVSLYTSIPHEEAIETAIELMTEHSYTYHELNMNDLRELLYVTLENNFFTFENFIYKQVHGLSMGSSVSAILAIIYMGKVELRALNLLGTHVAFYARYVDDVFLLTRSCEDAQIVFETFNSIDPNIKFEIEHPTINEDTKTLKLLDTAVSINVDGSIRFDFYKKSAKKPLFVNFKSALPTRSKMNYVRNERNRILNNCSEKQDAKNHLETFNSILKLNNYPDKFLCKPTTFPVQRNPNLIATSEERSKSKNKYSYLSFPFINDSINRKITKCFRREGLEVRLFHKTFSLRNALKGKSCDNKTCNKRECILKNELCLQKNVVYEIKCKKCFQIYIGSTIRPLHDRIHEHIINDRSSVKKHMGACGSTQLDVEVKILDREPRKGNLRIREAFHINKHKPQLNAKEESSIDLILF
ncbi:MAG: reverse transcriptase domain-containing protein [Pseudomonadota bacterium]